MVPYIATVNAITLSLIVLVCVFPNRKNVLSITYLLFEPLCYSLKNKNR